VGIVSQGIIIINEPSYEPQRWHGTLFVYAVTILTATLNIWAARYLPRLEIMFVACHVLLFFPVLITLLVMAPRKQSPIDVFLHFTDNGGGWPTHALDVMVGQVAASFILLGEYIRQREYLLNQLFCRLRCTSTFSGRNSRRQYRGSEMHVLVVPPEHTSHLRDAVDIPFLCK
jgi:hypothetical protein